MPPECAPFGEMVGEGDGGEQPPEVGASFACQGQGTGWLVTDVYGLGDPVTSCLAYDTNPVPQYPQADDCGWRSMEAITGAYGIPNPVACCTETTEPPDIANTCLIDCSYAAVKVAVEAIRYSADNLQPSQPLLQGAIDTAKADLHSFADYIETPAIFDYCVNKVLDNPGEVVSVNLGGGPSNSADFGHIKNATLYLSCAPDPEEPFVLDEKVLECTEPANIPVVESEQTNQGTIASGSVVVNGPGVSTVSPINNATFEFRETLNRDLSVDFLLTRFTAAAADTSAGSFDLRNIELTLAAPASGFLEGEQVRFAAGTLRFAVTASISVDGEPLFEGAPVTAEYTNSGPATAIRTVDGAFAFIDAPFTAGEYVAKLNTEPAPIVPVQ